MFCSKCGTEIPAGAAFCHKCGAKVLVEDIVRKSSQLYQTDDAIVGKSSASPVASFISAAICRFASYSQSKYPISQSKTSSLHKVENKVSEILEQVPFSISDKIFLPNGQ